MKYVLDASVYAARIFPLEKHHQRAKELWRMASSLQFHVPAIFQLEVVSAFSRSSMEQEAINKHEGILSGTKFVAYPIDDSFLKKAITVARDGRVRSADAIYLALALQLDATFLTLDFKLRKHLSSFSNPRLQELKILS